MPSGTIRSPARSSTPAMPHIWQSFSSDLTRQAIVFSKHSQPEIVVQASANGFEELGGYGTAAMGRAQPGFFDD
jgi:hypothetical protein